MAAEKARKQGRHTDAQALEIRYDQAAQEMRKRYEDEAANPEAALLVYRWAEKNR